MLCILYTRTQVLTSSMEPRKTSYIVYWGWVVISIHIKVRKSIIEILGKKFLFAMFTIATCVINKIYDIICYLILLRWETVLLGICLGKGFWSLVYWSAPGPCLCSSFEGQMWYTTLRGRHINYHTQISLEIWNLFFWFLKFVQSLLHC